MNMHITFLLECHCFYNTPPHSATDSRETGNMSIIQGKTKTTGSFEKGG